jgi:glutaredoxin
MTGSAILHRDTSIGAPRLRVAPILWLLLAALLALLTAATPARAADPGRIELFVREGCPHCAQAEAFMEQLGRERPELTIAVRDVTKDAGALARLQELVQATGAGAARVPAAYVNGQLILGYSTEASTDRLIRSALAGSRVAATAATDASSCEAEDSLSCGPGAAAGRPPAEDFSVELFGRTITLDDVGLPAFTLAMGLLDGFNPCSMWVLLLMISLLAPLNDRKRMLAIAGTFVLVEGIAYFAMMAAWLNLFLLIGLSRASQVAIAAIAIVAGLINVKDFFAFGRGITLSIPEPAKPMIYNRMRGILHAPNYTVAIVGTIVLALLVQVVEFMCTSGFPALFTRILTLRQLDTAAYYGYLLLYNAAYMLDDVIVLGIGVTLLSRHRLQEKEGRVLKLVAGVVMIGLGIYLLADG